MINRGEYWQCGLVIPKGAHEEIRLRGLPAFCDELARLAPFAGDRAGELRDWEMIRLLAVQVDRLPPWFLCIGDAAHAMSPVGGVGINLAIQDARRRQISGRAAARRPAQRGRSPAGTATPRAAPRITQRLQLLVQNRVIKRVLGSTVMLSPPLALRLFARLPSLRRIPARLMGLGIRPEHIA